MYMEANTKAVYTVIVNHPKVGLAGIRNMTRLTPKELRGVIDHLKEKNLITRKRNGYAAVPMYTQLSLYGDQQQEQG